MSLRFAFYGRVSTEDAQDPEASRSWQKRRAIDLITPHGGVLVSDYFDVGQSRSLPWKRRPEASRLLADVTARDRGFDAVVIGEPARAFYGPQFALTFPVLTHYGVGLWVPEVGGAVDPGSEAHDLVMTLFGGMSKGERARIQMRVRTAMSALAQDTSRYLGGRPPYGYRLVDAGPHPNPAKANLGQRLHRLEPDPVTSPIVERIYRMYADGAGLRYIAQQLTDDGVPSPSQHDPARNRHRDARGWAHSAIRAILDNPVYTGIRIWGKQEKYEVLVNPDDVAAGYETRMRWRDQADWIAPDRRTHEALISHDLAQAVRHRHDRLHERFVVPFVADVLDEGLVDLQGPDRELLEVTQRRVPGAEIVERQRNAKVVQVVEDLHRFRCILNQHALGDLQFQQLWWYVRLDQRLGDIGQQIGIAELLW